MNTIILQNKIFFTWDIHYQCNYYCTYCFLHFEPKTANIKAHYLNSYQWFKIWENIYNRYGYGHISITGGEPFIYPDFIQLISLLQEYYTFEFSTNLSWDVDFLMKNIRSEKVRINSSFHPEYVKIEDFINKILVLRNNNYQVSVTLVAYPPMLEGIKSYKQEFEKHGFNLFIFPYRGPYNGKKYPEAYNDSEKDILKIIGSSFVQDANRELYHVWVDKKDTQSKQTICRMGQKYAKVTPDGNAYRCCAAVHKEWGCLGNIVDNSFNFTEEPQNCFERPQNCVCSKAMIVGEEDNWAKRWDSFNKRSYE